MRLKFTIIIFLLVQFTFINAQKASTFGIGGKSSLTQSNNSNKTISSKEDSKSKKNKSNITGIWRGYFLQKNFNPRTGKFEEDRYKYEVQINNLSNNALEGVTYSYRTTTFYGKAALQGIFTKQTQNILIKETKMLELKISGFSEPCLMTCYLDYKKEGKTEILKGDYTSQNLNTKDACGDGVVYLEKVPDTEFEKEAFLLKPQKQNNAIISKKEPLVKNNSKPQNTKENITANITKSKFKPGAEDALIKPNTEPKKEAKEVVVKQKETNAEPKKIAEPKVLPNELTERKNNLIKTLYVDEGELLIELYDNGQIDNDSVSIYHNGNPAILHGKLSTQPLQVKINVSAVEPIHEFIMVADNLGTIPPNTALMVVTAGKKTYEVFLTSDLQRNAKIVFEYKPSATNNKK